MGVDITATSTITDMWQCERRLVCRWPDEPSADTDITYCQLGYQARQGKSGPHFEAATLLTAFLCPSTILFAMIYTGKVWDKVSFQRTGYGKYNKNISPGTQARAQTFVGASDILLADYQLILPYCCH